MIKVTIYKMFHRSAGVMLSGESFSETMRFVDFNAADNWARDINKRHAKLPYHITGFSEMDPQGRYASSFCMFDISEIWDTNDVTSRDANRWSNGGELANKTLAELRKTLFYASKRADNDYCDTLRDRIEQTLAA